MKNELTHSMKKRIGLILIVGALLIIADVIMSFAGNTISIIQDEGKLYMIRPEMGAQPGHLNLKAFVDSDSEQFEKKFTISIEPYSKEHGSEDEEYIENLSDKEIAEYELRTVMGALNNDVSKHKVLLPSKLKSGATITWRKERNAHTLTICFLILGALVAVYSNKLSETKKEKKRQNDSVMRQLPEFANRLVLLLNAGLVLNTAFEKAMEVNSSTITKNDYFREHMNLIYDSVKHANGSMSSEFRKFAKASGVKELIRISNIISDNINKGVELNEKLQRESELLWITRKKNCEEQGRLAETKLTLPLVMFLMVLIVITITPALIEL